MSARSLARRLLEPFRPGRTLEQRVHAVSPRLHRRLILRGTFAETKWRRLPHEKLDAYLDDEHPDREGFVDLVAASSPCSVLEVGAGALRELTALRDRGLLGQVEYTVLDVAADVLERGRELVPEARFAEGSINRIPFPDRTFDVVYARAVVEHQPYYDQAIRELVRVSRGLVVLNLFRWSTDGDVIRRVAYYSNTYDVRALLRFVADATAASDHVLVLKGETPGENQYDDGRIRRTGDHLVVVGAVDEAADPLAYRRALERAGVRHEGSPYAEPA